MDAERSRKVAPPIFHGVPATTENGRLLSVWLSMIARCYNPNDRAYRHYGERGIAVCADWHDFGRFAADMDPRPDGLSLDRIDNDGPYSPENCRWADRVTQARNTRRSVVVDVGGARLHQTDLAKTSEVSESTISRRLRSGMSVAEAVSADTNKGKKLRRYQVREIKLRLCAGHGDSVVAQEFGVSRQMINQIRNGVRWVSV